MAISISAVITKKFLRFHAALNFSFKLKFFIEQHSFIANNNIVTQMLKNAQYLLFLFSDNDNVIHSK